VKARRNRVSALWRAKNSGKVNERRRTPEAKARRNRFLVIRRAQRKESDLLLSLYALTNTHHAQHTQQHID
jgi:hypothetical protein